MFKLNVLYVVNVNSVGRYIEKCYESYCFSYVKSFIYDTLRVILDT